MFCLLVVLVELSVLAKWLARKTPLRKPVRGEGIIATEVQTEECLWFSWFSILFHCLIMCFSYSLSPTLDISYSYGMIAPCELQSCNTLRKPNRGERIVSRKPRPKSAHDFLGLLYCFIVLLCICVVSCPYVIYYPTVMAQYSLFVLKVLLNPK